MTGPLSSVFLRLVSSISRDVRLHGADRPDRVVEVLLEIGNLLAGAILVDARGPGSTAGSPGGPARAGFGSGPFVPSDLLEVILEPNLAAGQLAQRLANLVDLRLQRGKAGLVAAAIIVLPIRRNSCGGTPGVRLLI